MERTRAHSIADVARLAGVSKSTVSRALNDSPLIGVETKERIRAIAREHDFHLNVRRGGSACDRATPSAS